MQYLALFLLILSVPLGHVGEPLAAPAPSTIFAPGHFHATVRIPNVHDRLFIIGSWTMVDMRVSIQRDGSVTKLSALQLPGARFGVELPEDAWQARSVEIDGSAVNARGGPKLVAGTALYAHATLAWPGIALLGMFAGLAIVAGLIAIAMRSAMAGWFSILTALNTLLAIPILGAIRPPAVLSQSLHALLVTLAIVASIGFARAYLGRTLMPRLLVWFAAGIALVQIVNFIGGDLWQDAWFNIPAPFELAIYVALDLLLLAIGLRATRAGRTDAAWYAGAQGASVIAYLAPALQTPQQTDIVANAVSLVALTCGLAFALRRREDERVRLEQAVRLDGLTGLMNRGAFDTSLSIEWSRAARTRTQITAIMMDVDNFKQYNDTFGHVKGDEVLRLIAGALSVIVQRREDCVARYGGEEFVALLPGSDMRAAKGVAEEVRIAVERLGIVMSGETGPITMSLGVATAIPETSASPSTLIALADNALYEAKRKGRNLVVAHDSIVAAIMPHVA